MLSLKIPPRENTIETPDGEILFVTTKGGTLNLEHSLISLSKWESKYKKPFLNRTEERTREESLYYIKCMTLNKDVSDDVYESITNIEINKVNEYIDDKMTATWFNENGPKSPKRNQEVVTSELIYYWMIALNIPVSFEKWHLNRLMTLIRVCEEKQKDPKKMKKSDIYARNRRLNAARRKRSGSKG